MKAQPEQVADYFFKCFMANQCHVCWNLFSQASQQAFLDWTVKDVYQRHPAAAEAAKLGPPEIRLMFEKNDPSLIKSFWKRFFFKSGANEIFRYGYYKALDNNEQVATVQVDLIYPDGRTAQVQFKMLMERTGWKFGYVESGLPF